MAPGLAGLFLLALLPRWYGAWTLGWDWDYPGSFTLVNFDEGGSCRAALGGFDYSTFVGRQTIAIAEALGLGPEEGIRGDYRAVKNYCHGAGHLRIARSYSAVAGALTAVLLCLLGWRLVPARPAVGWSAGLLLALSGFHLSESQSGTVDAASVFFIYAFLAWLVYSVTRGWRAGLLLSPLLLVPAVWAKYWVFAALAYLALLPPSAWAYTTHGMSGRRFGLLVLATFLLLALMTNSAFRAAGWYPVLAAWYLVPPWRRLHRPMAVLWALLPPLALLLSGIEPIAYFTTGGTPGDPGSGYGAIGWNKWLRNLVDLPVVLLVGLGLPACCFIPMGIRAIPRAGPLLRGWLCLLPVAAFALYMAFLSPITYYRHYLPLLPAAALLAALGLHSTRWGRRPWFLLLFFLWPALLALDLVSDYYRDPRIALRQWYLAHPGARVYASYYANPPAWASDRTRLFRREYASGDPAILTRADYLVLSENWYDTAFPNELNGPWVGDTGRLIKTRPEYARFFRDALAGRNPLLAPETTYKVENFMPELRLHRAFYGTFQLFVGDLAILRVVEGGGMPATAAASSADEG